MKQIKIVLGIILLIVAIYLSGCVEKTGMEGTYRCEVDDGVLDLLQNGQWELITTSGSFGHYTIMDNIVRLKLDGLGILVPMLIDGRDLIDPSGDRWVRD